MLRRKYAGQDLTDIENKVWKFIQECDDETFLDIMFMWFGDYVYTHLFELFEDAYINASRREQEEFLKEVMAEYGDRIRKIKF